MSAFVYELHSHTHAHTHAHTHTHTHTHKHTHTHTHTHTHARVYTHHNAQAHTHTHTTQRTRPHTNTQASTTHHQGPPRLPLLLPHLPLALLLQPQGTAGRPPKGGADRSVTHLVPCVLVVFVSTVYVQPRTRLREAARLQLYGPWLCIEGLHVIARHEARL